ncbi:FtsX-like permease family protein [Micromonospora pattaloongensis]|uniref:FtsX-like permease family protein n=1 Tax=Micromonospora pattaloongensis TaxID=405436 RepID=A0A1H3K1Y8_9ACTN|nr:FtsX-like permease family protein [Micromonospora pattaloongensis]SDY46196.1 FtsX-like permease family protein [Micromonospora pattaloongensis]
MRLVLRRARAARGLLLAAAAAALIATAMVTGLVEYNRQATAAGERGVVEAAATEERSLLISGSGGADAAAYEARDAAIRAEFAGGVGRRPVTVLGARYGTGRQLTGDLAGAAADGPAFASMVALDGLPDHVTLTRGAWPRPDASPLQIALPERTAETLGVTAGDRIPVLDRSTDRASELSVAGVWRPRDVDDPYWRLVPDVVAPARAAAATGPFVLDGADFRRAFPGSISAAWLVQPRLTDATVPELVEVGAQMRAAGERAAQRAGLGTSGQAVTELDRLAERLSRASAVGRSALVTPMLLIALLGGYTLVLLGTLLTEERRSQTALLRARGAARGQLAGFAAREAALFVVPGAGLAPLLSVEALRQLDRAPLGATAELPLDARLTAAAWLVAAVAALGCLLVMTVPALRAGSSYAAELAARSRPDRRAGLQRAGLDLALVAFALIAWVQLRQYSSPLAGFGAALGIDPLLVVAPTLGVLAGTVLALRLLPPLTRAAVRYVDRKLWTATILGMWQAGRRPHAGPVFLLALAVAASALAWCVIGTWQRSLGDQADHHVGADLRLLEDVGVAQPDRARQLAGLPGVRAVVPVQRDSVRVGAADTSVTVLALDPATAHDVVRLRDGLADEPLPTLLDRMTRGRVAAPGPELPADARRLTGVIATPHTDPILATPVTTAALFDAGNGRTFRRPVTTTGNDGRPQRFSVELPDTPGRPLRFAGFQSESENSVASSYGLRATELAVVGAAGRSTPLELGSDGWELVHDGGRARAVRVERRPAVISTSYQPPSGGYSGNRVRFAVTPPVGDAPVPVLASAALLRELDVRVGQTTALPLGGREVPARIVGEVAALPTTDDVPAAALVDLPSMATYLLHTRGATIGGPTEWWVATEPAGHGAAARAAAQLPGIGVLDRRALADEAERDPYWLGTRTGFLVAALGAVLLALVGLAFDVWATARRRLAELAVLHTLGATPRLLARALIAEQAFLAGLGVAVGLLVGVGVAATMAPLVILTPSAGRPVPPAAFELPWGPLLATAAGLLAVAVALSASIAATVRQRAAAAQLRIGVDR